MTLSTPPVLRPARLGSINLKNRLGLGPINPGFASPNDAAFSDIVEFYKSYGASDVGLVYIGGIAVSPEGRSNGRSMVMSDRGTQDLVTSVAQQLEQFECVLAVQLMHSGRQASSSEIGFPRVAASSIACPYFNELPRAATEEDLLRVRMDFQRSAAAAYQSGAQVIEIHAAHGYLLSGFLSASSNARTDIYGGSIENRFRFLSDVLRDVRGACGAAVGIRVNVYEQGGGISPYELSAGLSQISDLFDFVSVSAGTYSALGDVIIPRRSYGPAPWRSQATILRKTLGKPVMLCSNIESIDLVNDIVEKQDADVALMVRSLLADPHLLKKWTEGRAVEIQPCTELYMCKYHSRGATNVYCPHNPYLRKRSLLPRVKAT
ncbi:oxidoreductase [Amycolatopsis thermoflava]|uniref:oxidoreductase n=1 Tax=Amycolatopsis thermoflava TaxID=84480 RepID=UPI00381D2C52